MAEDSGDAQAARGLRRTTQPSVSALESGDLEKAGLATIRDHVEALGGKVEMIADFGDHGIVIGRSNRWPCASS